MSKGNSLSQDDVSQILKGAAIVFVTCITFVIWAQIDNLQNLVARSFIILGTEAITTALITAFILSLIDTNEDIDWSVKVGTGLISLIGVIGNFCEISYLANNWNVAAWPIFLIVWAGLGVLAFFLVK